MVNGAFAMDSTETHSERELGRIAGGAPRVLVGGLGLGHTVVAVLEEADRLGLACGWTWSSSRATWWPGRGRGVRPRWPGWPPTRASTCTSATSRRSSRAAGRSRPGPWDAILLDVDNGPDFLIHAQNDVLYGEPGLRAAYGRLAPAGVLAIWCQAPSPPLLEALRRVDASAEETRHTVRARGPAVHVRGGDRPPPTGLSGPGPPGAVRQDDRHGQRRRPDPRVPDRARHDGRGPGAAGRAVEGADPAGRRELPDLGHPDRAGPGRRPRDDQGRRGADERPARPPARRTAPTPSPPPRPRSRTGRTTPSSRSTSSRPARAPRAT